MTTIKLTADEKDVVKYLKLLWNNTNNYANRNISNTKIRSSNFEIESSSNSEFESIKDLTFLTDPKLKKT